MDDGAVHAARPQTRFPVSGLFWVHQLGSRVPQPPSAAFSHVGRLADYAESELNVQIGRHAGRATHERQKFVDRRVDTSQMALVCCRPV